MHFTLLASGWTRLFVFLGVALRLFHWLRDPVVWHDEAALLINVLRLDFGDFLGPLLLHEAAPPLFLVIERLTLEVLGDSPMALRLPAVLASILALCAFSNVSRRMLTPWAATGATALFAVSDRFLWHAAEAKPYSFDVLVAVGVAWGFLGTRPWSLGWQCALWVVVLPAALWLSYPACFIAGGLLLALLPGLIAAKWGSRTAYVGLVFAVAGSFAFLVLGPAAAQRDGPMESCWVRHFADWDHPFDVPAWSLFSTLEVFRYGLFPLGQTLAGVAVIGSGRWWRSDSRMLVFLTAPVALGLIAALLRCYPFGGSRVCVFAVPGLLVLIGAGLPPTWAWLRSRSHRATAVLVIAFGLPFVQTAYRVVVPWPRADFAAACGHVIESSRPADVVVAGNWECYYYLRGRERSFRRFAEVYREWPSRFWVVTVGEPDLRREVIHRVPTAYDCIEWRDFSGTTAALFERRGGAVASTSGGRPIP